VSDVVGTQLRRGPKTMLPLLKKIRKKVKVPMAACRWPTGRPRRSPRSSRSTTALRLHPARSSVPDRPRPVHVQPLRDRRIRPCRLRPRRALSRASAAVRARITSVHCRGAWAQAASQPLLARHVEALYFRRREKPGTRSTGATPATSSQQAGRFVGGGSSLPVILCACFGCPFGGIFPLAAQPSGNRP
jgi:hypothetical protein